MDAITTIAIILFLIGIALDISAISGIANRNRWIELVIYPAFVFVAGCLGLFIDRLRFLGVVVICVAIALGAYSLWKWKNREQGI